MMTQHVTDQELQQYAMNKAGCAVGSTQHIESCEACRAAAGVYRQLFADIAQQPKPVFDFDVSALVLRELPVPAGKTVRERGFNYWLAGIVCFAIGIPLYLFRKNIYFLFEGISGYAVYIIAGAALPVVLIRLWTMYRKYRQQMKALNLY
jgi:predicted cobalt transporter CbtA